VRTGDGVSTSFGYDGSLLTSVRQGGVIAGVVERTFDAEGLLSTVDIGGVTTAFSYDNDGLLTRAGDLVLDRAAASGRVTGTAMGGISTTVGYDGYGAETS